jgi:hypothetical protein
MEFDVRYVGDETRTAYFALTGLRVRIGTLLTQAVGLGWARSPLWGSTATLESRAERDGEADGRLAVAELQQFCSWTGKKSAGIMSPTRAGRPLI